MLYLKRNNQEVKLNNHEIGVTVTVQVRILLQALPIPTYLFVLGKVRISESVLMVNHVREGPGNGTDTRTQVYELIILWVIDIDTKQGQGKG